jgi:hypothetical protein
LVVVLNLARGNHHGKKTTITDKELGNACVPEDYFFIPEIAPNEVNEGVLSALLDRAHAIVLLIESDGDSDIGFQWNHKLLQYHPRLDRQCWYRLWLDLDKTTRLRHQTFAPQ